MIRLHVITKGSLEHTQFCCFLFLQFTSSSCLHKGIQGRNQLFISGGAIFMKFHFDDVIVLIQPWYNFFANGHI